MLLYCTPFHNGRKDRFQSFPSVYFHSIYTLGSIDSEKYEITITYLEVYHIFFIFVNSFYLFLLLYRIPTNIIKTSISLKKSLKEISKDLP